MFKNPKGSKPIPRNTRAVGVARDTIEFLSATAQRTLQNAITGDGRHCLLYMPKTGGVKCSCHNEDPLDTDGKMRPEVINAVLNNAGVELGDYRDVAKSINTDLIDDDDFVVGDYKTTDASPVYGDSQGYSTKTFSLSDIDDENFDADDFDLDLDVGLSDEPKIPSLQNGYVPTTSISTTSCPICLGTGWVGGFDLYGGTRLVLSACSATRFIGCHIVDGNPDYVEMTKGSSIVFENLMLPAGVNRVDEISVWDHRDKIPFIIAVDGNAIPVQNLGLYFDGTKHSISLSPINNTNVTHVTIQYGITDILIDVSKKSISTNNSVYDQQSEVSLVLPPVTNKELKGAIVYDSTDDKLYRVTSQSTSTTQGGWIQNIDVEARVIQPYELTNLLPRMNLQKIKKFGGSFSHASARPRHF